MMLEVAYTTKGGEVIEEEIITTGDADASHEFQDELLPSVVRSEMNFLRLPFFSFSWRGLKKKTKTEYRLVEERGGKKMELKWLVTANAEFGYPTPFDHKVARAFDVVVDEVYVQNGYQLVNPIPFSRYRLARLMQTPDGKSTYRRIKQSLERMVATTVTAKGTYYLKDKKRWIDRTFHPYEDVVFMGEETDDGSIAETNYLKLHKLFLRNINARYVRPLDYEFLCSLKNPLSKRVYEVLSPKFYGLDKRLSYYHIDYQDYCQTLPATPQRYHSDVQKQFKVVHEELGKGEFISKVAYVLHRNSRAVKTIRFYLGERARAEQNGELLKRAKYLDVEEQLLLPIIEEGKKKSIELTGLAGELYKRDVRPESKCQELVDTYPEERIKEKIGMYDAGIIEGGGGLVRAIEQDWQPTEKQRQSVAVTKKEQKSRDRKERWKEERQKRIDQEVRDWDKISPEKRIDIEGVFKGWILGNKVDENSEAARIKKQEYMDRLPKTKAEIRRYIDEKVVLNEPPEDFE